MQAKLVTNLERWSPASVPRLMVPSNTTATVIQQKAAAIMSLRCIPAFPGRPKTASDWAGSALVGWFAVTKEIGDVYEWDVGNDAVGKKLAAVNSQR